MRLNPLVSTALALAAAGCAPSDSAENAPVGGTLVVSVPADADFLLPPLVGGDIGKAVSGVIYEHLAEIGDDLNSVGDQGFEPRLAERWEWAPDSLSIAFHLDPDARWHDGRPVRASDVRFTHALYVDPVVGSSTAPLIENIDSVTVRDSLTAVVWFRRRTPEQFYDVAYQLFILPEHVLKDVPRGELRSSPIARQPVGTGPFRFVRWDPRARIEVIADTANYRGRPNLDRLIWAVAPDPTTAITKLYAGEADLYENVRAEHLPEFSRHAELKTVPLPRLAYGFLSFNLRDPGNERRAHPILGEREVRRALAMAVDRQRIVRSVFDTLGRVAHGPFPRAHWTADTTLRQLPYDAERARRLLDSLGWRDANGDGVRERNGRPLAFAIDVPTSSKPRRDMAVLLQEQLKQVGAKVDINALEFTTFLQRQRDGKFEAVLGLWNTDPSPSGIRQTWTSAGARGRDGSNYGSYESPAFDALVDSALVQFDPAKQRAYFRRAYQTIIEDAPALFVYELQTLAGAHDRIQMEALRPDAWWAHIEDWSIPADRRIARDRIGLRASPEIAAAARPGGTR